MFGKSERRTQRKPGGVVLAISVLIAIGAGHLTQCSVSGFSKAGSEDPGESVRPDAAIPEVTGLYRTERPAVSTKPARDPVGQKAPVVGVPPARAAGTDPVKRSDGPATAAVAPRELVCPSADEARAFVMFSPAKPRAGKPLRVVAVSNEELAVGGLVVMGAEGPRPLGSMESWGGPTWSWSAKLDEAPAGTLQVMVTSPDASRPYACASVAIPAGPVVEDPPISTGAWSITRAWSGDMESLYSAWVARLFQVDAGAKAGWRPLHQVLRDPKRNILHNHLGLREDDDKSKVKVVLMPDCADTPFFLRAYFSWKMQLPFAMRRCLRGTAAGGPECNAEPISNLTDEWDDVNSVVERFNRFVGLTVSRSVHSGTVRTIPEDPTSDLYPLALTREALRPGTVFADSNGHVLVLTRWVAGTPDRMGMLLAVDAHPDRTVSHKRFSPANFYFAAGLKTGGFKAFRPAVYEHGKVRFMTNDELAANPGYANFSVQQYGFDKTADFYRTVFKALNPFPLDPVKAYRSQMEAIVELLEERVSAVQVGVEYMNSMAWQEMEMPEGGLIFETTGPWEDFSTPARDLRLLVAIDELKHFPRTVMDEPDLFDLPAGKTLANIRADVDAEWERGRSELTITYTRSDRSTWTLTLGEVLERLVRFEQAYNPNDCPEVRWGAAPGSTEAAPCSHRAPREQQRRMEAYRVWHAERRRPAGF